MASGAHDLVLRDLRARRVRPRLSARAPALPHLVQFVLRRRRCPPSTRRARLALASHGAGGPGLPPAGGCSHPRAVAATAGGARERAVPPPRPGVASRATTPGAPPGGHQAHL